MIATRIDRDGWTVETRRLVGGVYWWPSWWTWGAHLFCRDPACAVWTLDAGPLSFVLVGAVRGEGKP